MKTSICQLPQHQGSAPDGGQPLHPLGPEDVTQLPLDQGPTLTDVGNGERLKAQHGADLLYCYPWKSWFVWDGRRFREDDDGEVIRRAKATATSIFDEGERAHATRTQQRPRLEAMIWAAQSELSVQVPALDRDDDLLNLENGTLDLRTLTLREHNRSDKLTKLAPVSFDGSAGCPLWIDFLKRVLGNDPELLSFVQRACGYTLSAETSEHVLFLLYGTGANGKSTFIETMLALLGDYGRPTEFRTLLDQGNSHGVRNDLAALVGVRLVTAVEVGEGKQLDEAVVKQVTGGDTITARKLFQEFFDFKPRFKLWLAANYKPEIRGVDEAIWRRVLLVPFEVTIPPQERDHELGRKLRAELPGILAWAVEGLRAWRKYGLQPPQRVIAATAEYRHEQDLLADFLEARCIIGAGHFVVTSDLNAAYGLWAGGDAVRARMLGRLLRAHGFHPGQRKVEGKNHKCWVGLKLSDVEVAPGDRGGPAG